MTEENKKNGVGDVVFGILSTILLLVTSAFVMYMCAQAIMALGRSTADRDWRHWFQVVVFAVAGLYPIISIVSLFLPEKKMGKE